ncbi:DUF1435 domain-containing protein [Erwinia mallotivora]|uniref:Membrane protein n=1 Tax=Erwinia mallotivora TaxID=69222 RepID=A0A014M8K2_9GAMM|nr:DUF1435 domain-containing protein [Erwinia mallotivora]EXU74434.1 membrane protein [Erwinia mallotivora]
MLTTKVILWRGCESLVKRLDSAWGVVLPCLIVPPILLLDLSFTAWRAMMVSALLMTIAMLFHQRSRHYLLLPSCLAVASGMAAISVNFSVL